MITLPVLVLSALATISAALTIRSKYVPAPRGKRQELVFKPLTMLLVIGIALVVPDAISPTYRALIVAGLVASLAGDVLLIFPTRFVPGLISFLVAHLIYIVAFTATTAEPAPWWMLIPFVLYGALMLWQLWPHLGSLRPAVLIYVGVILVMAWQAASRWVVVQERAEQLALLGAYLFVASDSVLAFERFRGGWRSAAFWGAQSLLLRAVADRALRGAVR